MVQKLTRLVNLLPVVCVICYAVPAAHIMLCGLDLPWDSFILPAAAFVIVILGYTLQHIMAMLLGLNVERYGFVGRSKGRIEKFRIAFAPIPTLVIAVLAGVPMYADIFGTIPIAQALLAKGARLGVVLSFMMAVTTLSLPSMVMLGKAIKRKLLGIFVLICTIGIIFLGYVFNGIAVFLL